MVKQTRVISPLLSDKIKFPIVFQANKWKEQCSRAIQWFCKRSEQPYIQYNCISWQVYVHVFDSQSAEKLILLCRIIDKMKPRYRLNMALRTDLDATPTPKTDGLSVNLKVITSLNWKT